MTQIPFVERLQQTKPLLGDGAMGTFLHQRTHLDMQSCFEELNITQPDAVQNAHSEYLKAGSDLIESNTFGANRIKLAQHNLAHKLREINQAGVQLARQAVAQSERGDGYVLGSMGPLGVHIEPYGKTTRVNARETFIEQAQALIDAAVDGIILETFVDHRELLLAVGAVRAVSQDIVIIAQVSFPADTMMLTGYNPARVANDLYQAGVKVIGVNCGGGPTHVAEVLQKMTHALPQMQFSAMPNAGYPETVGGRFMYSATADYFGDYALTLTQIGAKIVGGCCGTTPEHIASMRRVLDNPQVVAQNIQIQDVDFDDLESEIIPTTNLYERLQNGEFTITTEMTPPRSFRTGQLLNHARMMREAGVNVLNVVDTPAAKMKMSAWAAAHLLQSEVGIETILHFPTRGRNLLRVQGDLLAAHALDLRNLFVTMGDPTHIGDYPQAMNTFDIAPSKLIDLIQHSMNTGCDLAGNSIGIPTKFVVGCALNMAVEGDDLDRELKVLQKKLDSGADFALGQAVFDTAKVEAFHTYYESINEKPFELPVIMGVFLLHSIRQAQYLHNEVPGIVIPDSIFKRLEDAGEDAPQEGVKIAKELIAQMRGVIQGVYIIPPMGRYDLAAEVVNSL